MLFNTKTSYKTGKNMFKIQQNRFTTCFKSFSLGNKPKTLIFASFLSCLHQNLANCEEADFDQHLDCAAPKHWSKYITPTVFQGIFVWISNINKFEENFETNKAYLQFSWFDLRSFHGQ